MSSLSSPSQRLGLILDALRRGAAAHAARRPSVASLVVLLWSYLNRLGARFDALVARSAKGRLAPPAAPRPGRIAGRARVAGEAGRPRLPQGFAWLVRLAPELRPLDGQLRHLLCDAEMTALLDAAPAAGRILRPLCRMLGIGPAPDLPPALFPTRPGAPELEPRPRPVARPAAAEPAAPAPPVWARPATA